MIKHKGKGLERYEECRACHNIVLTTAVRFFYCSPCTKKGGNHSYIKTNCIHCNKEFLANKKTAKYCSQSCTNYYNKDSEKIKYFRRSSVINSLRAVLWGAKARAKRLNREYNLTQKYVLDLLETQEGKCAATGILLEPSAQRTCQNKNPFTVSIDRIDSSKGYIIGNIQIVCSIYNSAKNSYSTEEVKKLCIGFIKTNNININE